MGRYLRFAMEAGAVLVIFLGVTAWRTRSAVRGPAPQVQVRDLRGSAVRLGTPAPRPTLVYFFATWCGVCRAAEHNLAAVARDRDVIAIATDSGEADDVEHYIREHGLGHVRIVNDPRSALAGRYGVQAFPTAFYIDSGGSIRFIDVGFATEIGMRARLWAASW